MQSNRSKAVIASAGSRKTSLLVESALALPAKRILITTYTNENLDQINSYLVQRKGHVPPNITVLSWFSFLLQEGVRPYQNHLTDRPRIRQIVFSDPPAAVKFAKKTEVEHYYLSSGGNIYRDRVSDFAIRCNEKSGGLVIKRLQMIYDQVYVDEVQDFAGYDLDVLEQLLRSSIVTVMVGDPRQATFSTNKSQKNKQFKKSHIADWIRKQAKAGLLDVEERCDCYRSNQVICDFADNLFPHLSKTVSKNTDVTGHDGLFAVGTADVLDYHKRYSPVVLRHNKATDTMNLPAVNIGLSKGRTFDRVLIFPTKPMKDYWKTRDIEKAGDLPKLYVAVTRAKYSVAFVI